MNICYVKAYFDWIEQTAALSDAERGRLFIAILEYARSGLEPKLDGREGILFPVFRTTIDRDNKKSASYSENGKKGGRGNKANKSDLKQNKANESKMPNIRHKTQDKDKDKDKDYISSPPPLPRKAPTFDEVVEYAKLRGGLIDPKPFYDFYSVANWRDTEGKPVYNWQQKFQLWEKRELEKKGGAMNGHGHDTGRDTKKWNVPGAVNL